MEMTDEQLLNKIFYRDNQERVTIHLKNLKESCPDEFRGFNFIIQKLAQALPPEVTSTITVFDLVN